VSCAAPGSCSAVGTYDGGPGVFVVSERRGVWGKAHEAPGLAALGEDADLGEVSCGAPGDCSFGGSYGSGFVNGVSVFQAFVLSERDGVWGRALAIPGMINQSGNAVINSVSCAKAGGCSAAGTYLNRAANSQGFVLSRS
jgi:hypothetical protein